jgi:hypothetical protein
MSKIEITSSHGIGRQAGPAVEVIEVVRTRLTSAGTGDAADPVRTVTQYWSTEGQLLAEVDDLAPA